MSNDPLFQPLKLGNLMLKNRIMSTTHAIAYQDDGKPKERYQPYHKEKARGGLALTMFGGSSNVDYDSASVFGQLYVGNDDIIPYFKRAVQIPIFHATRVGDIATAHYAIREDMIGMTRAHIVAPHLVNKIKRGEEERVRPCVGATMCSTDY